jgi:hypothetical protein
MPIPAPFTPAAHSAGILTNITSDLLKHHFHDPECTLAGCTLKWAMLMKPDFDDRLRDTLSRAMNLYFETYLRYKLADITAFFRDPVVARPTGGCILDRKLFDYGQTQQVFDWHLVSDGTTQVLIRRNL